MRQWTTRQLGEIPLLVVGEIGYLRRKDVSTGSQLPSNHLNKIPLLQSQVTKKLVA